MIILCDINRLRHPVLRKINKFVLSANLTNQVLDSMGVEKYVTMPYLMPPLIDLNEWLRRKHEGMVTNKVRSDYKRNYEMKIINKYIVDFVTMAMFVIDKGTPIILTADLEEQTYKHLGFCADFLNRRYGIPVMKIEEVFKSGMSPTELMRRNPVSYDGINRLRADKRTYDSILREADMKAANINRGESFVPNSRLGVYEEEDSFGNPMSSYDYNEPVIGYMDDDIERNMNYTGEMIYDTPGATYTGMNYQPSPYDTYEVGYDDNYYGESYDSYESEFAPAFYETQPIYDNYSYMGENYYSRTNPGIDYTTNYQYEDNMSNYNPYPEQPRPSRQPVYNNNRNSMTPYQAVSEVYDAEAIEADSKQRIYIKGKANLFTPENIHETKERIAKEKAEEALEKEKEKGLK